MNASTKHDHAQHDHSTMDHSAMDHASMGHASMEHASMEHGSMEHGSMEHSAHDHAAMGHDPAQFKRRQQARAILQQRDEVATVISIECKAQLRRRRMRQVEYRERAERWVPRPE